MSGFKGTRGKWRLVESTCGLITETQCISIRVGEDDIITVWDFSEESQANALLISKAPQMLEMLERVVALENIIWLGGAVAEQWVGEAQALREMMDKIKQLIKEATEL